MRLHDIESAPKDGSLVTLAVLTDKGNIEACYPKMEWDPKWGMWVYRAENGVVVYCWSGYGDSGPTHWKRFEPADVEQSVGY